MVVLVRGGLYIGGGAGVGLQSGTKRVINNVSRLGNTFQTMTSGAALNVVVGIGLRANAQTVTAGDQQKFRIGYRAVIWDLSGIP